MPQPKENKSQITLYPSHEKSHEELTKWFRQGDTVLFKVTSTYTYNGKTVIKGTTVDKPYAQVEVEETGFKATIGDILEVLMTQIKMLYGTWRIIGISPVKSDVIYESVNSTILTDRILNQLDTKKCIACDAKPTNDMENTYVYYNANCREHEFLCNDCFAKGDEGLTNYGTI